MLRVSIKNFTLMFILSACVFFSACSQNNQRETNELKVAATAVPHAEILEYIIPDLKQQGINLVIVVTDDYNIPNLALVDGSVDANFFQHSKFLAEQIKEFNYPIMDLARIELEPMGVYSKTLDDIQNLPNNSTIAIPNDPSNESRALFLLQTKKIIKLQENVSVATVVDIIENPKQIKFIEIDASMLPRAMADVTAAIINANYALQAKLDPLKDALLLEDQKSDYANLLVVKRGNENKKNIQILLKCITSEKVRNFILQKYNGVVIPVF